MSQQNPNRLAELTAAVQQAEATLDRKRQYLERAVRYHDECPDGDRRKPEAERRLTRVMAEYHAAEDVALAAADALIDYDAGAALGQWVHPVDAGLKEDDWNG
jgi:hypothetical protein